MTTKFKIIVGFIVMIVLLAAMAGFAYYGLQQSSDGFVEYRRNARMNVAASDLGTSLYAAAAKTYDFVYTGQPATIEEGLKKADDMATFAKDGETETNMPTRLAIFQEFQKRSGLLRGEQQKVRDSVLAVRKLYSDSVRPSLLQIVGQLQELSDAADRIDNARVLYVITQLQTEFAQATPAFARLAQSAQEEDAQNALQRLAAMGQILPKIEPLLQTEGGRRSYRQIADSHSSLTEAAKAMAQNAVSMRTALANMLDIESRSTTDIATLNESIDTGMREVGTATLEANDSTQNRLFIISVAGVIIGTVLASLIILGIVHALGDMSHFAAAIASGNFAYQVKSKEKGEVGIVLDSMKQIPTMLNGMIGICGQLAHDINVGKLRARGDVSTLPGSFVDLGNAINGIGDAFTHIIDAMPMPLMACDKNCNVLFFNKAGQAAIGSNPVGAGCKDILGAPECATDKCLGKNCMSQQHEIVGETVLTLQGKRMNVSVNALPLTDMDGKVEGFIEIINDLTEIRSQQATMLQVAEQASEISNRVAAASEELSAQVEQVSRGAEMQRTRMESTASAMTEMNATVLEVARSAGQASEQTENTRQKAQEGAELVKRVMDAINSVNAIGQQLRVNMEELGKQAESIGGVMGVISDIADQTNLLALNAAIEAARAGEAGRGFAVVADEVRKLAEKTMEATQEVGSNISAVQQAARINVEEVGKVVVSVEEATGLADSSGVALAEIVDLASASSAVVASIATAAEEQSATSEEINHAIDEVNRVVAETAEGMVQSSAAVQDLSQMAQELRRVMEGLK